MISLRIDEPAPATDMNASLQNKPGAKAFPQCPVCQAADLAGFAQKDGYEYQRCAACGFVFLNPMPSQEDLSYLYQSTDSATEDYFPKARSRRRRALSRAIRLLPHFWNKSVLEIGCGGGIMVGAFQRLGASASGFDIGESGIAYARRNFPKATFHIGSYDSVSHSLGRYDLIYSSETIEHVADISKFMDLVRSLTADNGQVFITTPDIGSRNVPPRVEDWDELKPPIHVQLFDQHSLATLFSVYGFRTVKKFRDKKAGLKMLFKKEP